MTSRSSSRFTDTGVPSTPSSTGAFARALVEKCQSAIAAAVEYSRTHFEDPADIQNWVWTD